MRLPDLTGYNKFPTPIAISVNDGEWISPSVLAEDSCFWVGYALTNAGAGIVENVDVEISVDGNIIHDNTLASVGNGYYWYRYGIYTLESGKHEITFTIDPDNKIKESNEGNNTYTCSFVVEGPADWLIPFSWDQGGELFNTDVTINAYAPIDPDTGKRSITGCTNTAVTQVISYFVTQGHDLSLTLNNSDSYTEGGISIDGTLANARRNGNLSFDQINALLADFDVKSAEDVAALCYASGVVAKANYGSDATCTAYSTELFTRAGFKSVSTGNYEFWNGNKLSDKAWETVKRNISEERPVCVSLNKPNHAVIIDGYDSASDRVHINFGWGLTNGKKLDSRYDMILGSGWYTRAECDEMQVDYIMYDIVPNSPGDLRVDNIASLVAADKVKLDFKVANNGFNDIEASKAYIYDGTKKIATVSVDALKAKTSQVYTYYIAAGGLTAGTHKFKVVADGADMVKESFEDNNSRIKSVSITRDLQVSALTYARNTSADTVKLNFTVKNNGNVASGTHRAYVYDGTKKLATFSLSSIAGGVSKNYSYTLNAGNLAIGTHNFKVIADGAKLIRESNENNNSLTKSVSITRDLQVSALTYARNTSANTVKLNFTVKNNGNSRIGATKAYIYDGTKKLGTLSLAAFTAGASKTYSYTLNAGNLAIGTHKFKVIADGAGAVKESKENNNSLTKSISVTRDLQVSALTYARNTSANTVKLNFTVKNNGNSRVGASKAYLYDGSKKLATLSLAAFTANSSRSFSYTLNAANLANGTHKFKIVADGANSYRENNEKNNSLTNSVSVTRNLQVSSLSAEPGTENVKLTFTIKNTGNTRIGASKAYIYDGTKKLVTLSLASFNGNSGRSFSYTFAAGKLSAGTHNLKVVTTHSSSTLAVKVAPAVNKTIGGIANDVWDYMYEDLPKEAQYGNVTGSMFNDTLTFSANRSRRIGNISLASGNDKIIALNSAIYCEESEIVAGNIDMGSGNDTIAIGSNNDFEVKFIDMGSGNDTITVSGWDAELEVLDVLKCGSGNDTITVSSQAFVEFNSFDMGDGADRFTVSGGSHLYYSKDYNFGSGDDRFIVAAGGHLDFSEYYGEPGSGSGLDFGSGYDTLQLDGVLRLSSAEKCVSNLEKITGSGDIALDLTGSPDIDWIDKLLEGSDVEVINDLGLSFFNGRAAEANDNVISGSSVQSLTSQSNPHGVDFWLCGNAKAEAVDHGFADTTDFVKYTKSSGDNRLEISTWWGYGDLSDVLEVDVFNANGQQLTDDQYSFMVSDYLEADISQWQDGTYYLKLKVADTSAVSGMIRISD